MADKRRSRCQSPSRFEPVHGGHPYFHEYYVRTGVDDDVYSLGPVGRLADYKKTVGRIDQNTEAGSYERLIVNDDDAMEALT